MRWETMSVVRNGVRGKEEPVKLWSAPRPHLKNVLFKENCFQQWATTGRLRGESGQKIAFLKELCEEEMSSSAKLIFLREFRRRKTLSKRNRLHKRSVRHVPRETRFLLMVGAFPRACFTNATAGGKMRGESDKNIPKIASSGDPVHGNKQFPSVAECPHA